MTSTSVTPTTLLIFPIEFKKAEKASLSPALKNYINSSYREDPDTYLDDFRQLETLRNDIISLDLHESSIRKLQKYYGQLVYLSGKFPIDENHIQICFSWSNVFGKEKTNASSFSIEFEKMCVLFNLGALYSHLGCQESRLTGDGVKRAGVYFQNAAGAFKHIQQSIADSLHFPQSPDFQQSTLSCLTSLMLAQAQECFWIKAISSNMKDLTIAKVAIKISEFYTAAYEQARASGVFSSHWSAQIQGKSAYLKADAMYRKSCELAKMGAAGVSSDKNVHGDEIAWLQASIASAKKVLDFQRQLPANLVSDAKTLQSVAEKSLIRAEKDNNLIYLESVPNIDKLKTIDAAVVVEAIPLPDMSTLKDVIGTPWFANLVPFAVHQSLSVYTDRRDNFVKSEIAKLNEATAVANSFLASMNLPGAIEALEQPAGLPVTLLKRSEEVCGLGGANSLNDMLETVNGLAAKDYDILEEALQILDTEAAEDLQMREQFKERWSRTKSNDLTFNLRETARMYKDKIQKAKQSDLLVKSKIEKFFPYIQALCASKSELEASIPSSGRASAMTSNPEIRGLKSLLETLSTNIKKRGILIEEMKKFAFSDDIGQTLSEIYTKKQEIIDDEVFTEQIAKYSKFTKISAELIAEQENLTMAIQEANTAFSETIKKNDTFRQREQALQNLDSAYKAFKEISANFQEGIKFYTDFQNVLIKFRDNCKDFAFARNMDKKDYLSQLQSSLANLKIDSPSGSGNAGVYPGSLPPPGAWTPGMPLQYGNSAGFQQNQSSYPYNPNYK